MCADLIFGLESLFYIQIIAMRINTFANVLLIGRFINMLHLMKGLPRRLVKGGVKTL